MLHISNGSFSLYLSVSVDLDTGKHIHASYNAATPAFLRHHIPLTVCPTTFFYLLQSTELLKHFSFSYLLSFQSWKVDLWLSLLRLLLASPSSLGTKGSRNATMSLYSACAQMRVHEKRVTFNHLCSRAGIQLRMDGCRLTRGVSIAEEEEEGGWFL